MKRHAAGVLLSLAGFAVLAGTLRADARKPESRMVMVMECVVKPSMEAKFREAMKEDVAFCARIGFSYPWSAYAGDDGRYYFLHPVKDLADVEKLNAEYAESSAKDPAADAALTAKFFGTYESFKTSAFTHLSEFSISPADPYYPASEMGFLFLDIWYIEPEREDEAESAMKGIMALARSKGVRDTWYALVGGMGTDAPVYVFAGADKNQTEFIVHNAKMWELMGEEADAPYNKALSFCRKRESKRLWYDAELSYAPAMK